MSAETVGSVILWLIVLAVVIVIAVYLLRWLYRRSTKEIAFVRTGLGGEKVVISGGAFVVPVLHEITPVGMNAMRIEIARRQLTITIVLPTGMGPSTLAAPPKLIDRQDRSESPGNGLASRLH